eukprot:9473420-Pyramimonas_sp.AAC.1
MNFRRSTRISSIGAGAHWRRVWPRGAQRRDKKSARTSDSLCQYVFLDSGLGLGAWALGSGTWGQPWGLGVRARGLPVQAP